MHLLPQIVRCLKILKLLAKFECAYSNAFSGVNFNYIVRTILPNAKEHRRYCDQLQQKVYSFANGNVLFQIVRSRQSYFNHLYEIERDRAGEGLNDTMGKLASVRKGKWLLKK
jgi:hypothetical protein